jgi:transposase
MQITTIDLDQAKHVFQVHGVDAPVVEKRSFRRGQVLSFFAKLAPCRVGLEACAPVRLIPPQYVKAYFKRRKNGDWGGPAPPAATRS